VCETDAERGVWRAGTEMYALVNAPSQSLNQRFLYSVNNEDTESSFEILCIVSAINCALEI
jgi:hypothetical protein